MTSRAVVAAEIIFARVSRRALSRQQRDRLESKEPLRIFYSHPFYMFDDWTRVHAQLDAAWAGCYVMLAPNKRDYLRGLDNLHNEIALRVLEADVVLVPGKALRQGRRGWVHFELLLASKAEIPILPISFAHDSRPAKWIIDLAGRPQMPIQMLRSQIEKLIPSERRLALRSHINATRTLTASGSTSA